MLSFSSGVTMYRSLATLRKASAARALSAPLADAVGPRLFPEAVLEGVRQRNAFLDWLFYDVGSLTDSEARDVSPWLAAEGAILIVPPSGVQPLTRCASIDAFIDAGGTSIRTIVVAGVGSSALGSAALARNVADAMDAPVAAVVSGYGLADVAAEALGGFFWFGGINSVRHSFEWLDRLRESGLIADPSTSGAAIVTSPTQSKDTRTVQALLAHPALSFELLVGHSKGNLVLSEALFTLEQADGARVRELGDRLRIVTLSAKITMPRAFRLVVDVLGQFDGFGTFNSRAAIPTDVVVPNAGHHTNTELPWHLPVASVLRELRERGVL